MSEQTLLELAISNGASADEIDRVMVAMERQENREAKTKFLAAVTKFQANVPRITKTKVGHNFSYAPLADIVEQIKSTLEACGLSYRFEQNHNEGISVTCVLSHVDGHSEQTTMTASADSSGSKNAVQAIGSTVQYCQRYTLVGSLGLATADEDIDGRLPFQGLSESQQLAIDKALEDHGVAKDRLLLWAKVAHLSEISEAKYNACMAKIVAAGGK